MILPYVFNNGTEHDSTHYDTTTNAYGYNSPYFNNFNGGLDLDAEFLSTLGIVPQSIFIEDEHAGHEVKLPDAELDSEYSIEDTNDSSFDFPMLKLHTVEPVHSPAHSPMLPITQVILPTDGRVHGRVHSPVPTPLPPQFAASVIFASSPSAPLTSTLMAEPRARTHPVAPLSSGPSIETTPDTCVYGDSSSPGDGQNYSPTSNTSIGGWWH